MAYARITVGTERFKMLESSEHMADDEMIGTGGPMVGGGNCKDESEKDCMSSKFRWHEQSVQQQAAKQLTWEIQYP